MIKKRKQKTNTNPMSDKDMYIVGLAIWILGSAFIIVWIKLILSIIM